MTGFGRAESDAGGNKITVEMSTVNNRFLDYQIRLPRTIAPLEQEIKNILGSMFNRGKISVTVNWEQTQDADNLVLDEAKMAAYLKIYGLLKESYGLKDEPTFRDFVSLPDLIKVSKEDDDLEAIWTELKKAVMEASEAVVRMRRAEGDNLVKDMLERTASIAALTAEIEKLAPANIEAYRQKLNARIGELTGTSPVDEQRIALEVAIMSEKSDITEECIRLKSHVAQFDDSLKEEGPIGKRLNFILQEMNREANTIGSKSSDFEISTRVIAIKEEVERLREQVQNVE